MKNRTVNPPEKRAKIFTEGCMVSLFLVGGNLVRASRVGFSETVIAFLISLAVFPLLSYASAMVYGFEDISEIKSAAGKTVFILFSILAGAAGIYVAVRSSSEFISFAGDVMFLRIPGLIVAAVFLAFCGYLSSCGFDPMRKFSFIAFVFIALSALTLFAFSVPNLSSGTSDAAEEFFGELSASVRAVDFDGVFSAFMTTFAPAVLALVCLSSAGEECRDVRHAGFTGIASGYAVLLVCFLNSVLLFGSGFGAGREYPYPSAVSTITAGKLFMRMEGFAYIMYFFACALRVSVCLFSVSLLLRKILLPRRRRASGLLSFLAPLTVFLAAVLI